MQRQTKIDNTIASLNKTFRELLTLKLQPLCACFSPWNLLIFISPFPFTEFETYLKTKIEKLSQIETQNLDCKSPDYHEHFSTKSFDESKASVYFTPNDGHLSPQPLQVSPLHINYINEGIIGCEASGFTDGPQWRAVPMRSSSRNHNSGQRNSFTLPCDYLDEADEGNFIIPDPVYTDDAFTFHDVIDTPKSSMMSVSASTEHSTRRRKKRYRDHRRSRHSIENETLLMQDIVHDVSKGARPKVYYGRNNHYEAANGECCKVF